MYFFCFTRLKLFRNNREWLLRDGLGVTNNVWLWRASHFQLSRTKLWKLFRRFRHLNYQNFAGSLLGILREVLKKNQNRDSRYGKLLVVEHSSLVGSYPAHNIWVHKSIIHCREKVVILAETVVPLEVPCIKYCQKCMFVKNNIVRFFSDDYKIFIYVLCLCKL